MGLEKLEYLLTVEETGSISKAAEILYMSQPSLSKSIASVESSIGCKIFQRTSTGLTPTVEGKRYLLYARQAIELQREMLADLKRCCGDGLPRKRFMLGLTPMRSTATLSKTLFNFSNSGIQVELRSTIASDDELIKKLLSGEVDVAVVTVTPDAR